MGKRHSACECAALLQLVRSSHLLPQPEHDRFAPEPIVVAAKSSASARALADASMLSKTT
jgi:hypothetical protein